MYIKTDVTGLEPVFSRNRKREEKESIKRGDRVRPKDEVKKFRRKSN